MGRTRWAVTRRKACRYGSRGSDGWPDGKVDPVSAAMEKGFGPWKTAGKIQRHQAGLQGGFPPASPLSHSGKSGAGLHFSIRPYYESFYLQKLFLFLTQADISFAKKSGHFHLLITGYE